MKKLFVHMKSYKKECILGPLFKLLEASFELFVPLVVASIIDVGIANNDIQYIIKMCLILVLLGVVGLLFSVTAQYFSAKAAVGFVSKLKHALFSHIQHFSYTQLDTLGSSSMITHMTSDMNQIQNGVNMTLRLLLRSPFIVIGAMIMAFTIDVKSACVFAVAIPILALIVFGVILITIPMYKKVQTKLSGVVKTTRENLSGIRVIRAFCREEQEINEFREENTTLTKMQKFVGKISSLTNPLTFAIINIAIAALIYVGAIEVNNGNISQGQVIALYNYMSQILVELIKFANFIILDTRAIASLKRVNDVFEVTPDENDETKPQVSESKKAFGFHVLFDNVTLLYKGASSPSLENISFSVKRGETVGVIGGTGSGKTSLVNMIPDFYGAKKGAVYVDGRDVKSYDKKILRSKIGYVMQKSVLFSGTIRDNLKWNKENATDEEIYEALEIAQAKEVVDSKEGGLDYIVEQGGRNFSGGQRQRLTIARALVGKPEILILDDSASALDFATDAALRKAIKGMENTTVFIVSQRTSSIAHADKIIVLDDGEAVAIGKHEELLESCDVYREIYDSQYKKEERK